ncbi:MAG: helix-turn-helix transcriptional regulator [Rickettsiales bacterium]|nr:helix-turn-helix transcriptional regulator [Rickettsiales bacterium]
MSKLKENITRLTKKYGVSYRKLERKAGLAQNFISNILQEQTRSPNIDAVAKLAKALDKSLDELYYGVSSENISNDIEIDNESLFIETLEFIADELKNHTNIPNISNIFKVIWDIYFYSREQEKLDTKYATHCIKNKLLQKELM